MNICPTCGLEWNGYRPGAKCMACGLRDRIAALESHLAAQASAVEELKQAHALARAAPCDDDEFSKGRKSGYEVGLRDALDIITGDAAKSEGGASASAVEVLGKVEEMIPKGVEILIRKTKDFGGGVIAEVRDAKFHHELYCKYGDTVLQALAALVNGQSAKEDGK